ncbi:MAG: MFS transporter [Chitinispirillaceae bacterium]|nr:MFS transporter [Chitinispirillaceae bacterium]
MTRSVYLRLSAMMFLQFFIGGAFIPVLSLYLINHLHFSGSQAGIIIALTSLGSIIAPLFTVYIADRFIRSEYLLGVCHFAGGALMLAFSAQSAFIPATLFYLAYTLVTTPTFALTNAIVFHHSPGTRHRFGAMRVWGTIGWIAVAWLFSFFWLRGGGTDIAQSRLPDALKLAGLASFALGAFAFALPSSKRTGERTEGFLPLEALRILRKPEVALFCLFMLLITMVDRFYYFGTSPFLSAIGFHDRNIMPSMSLGQVPEVFGMFLLGWLIVKGGSKKIILLGITFDLFRYVACAVGGPLPLILAGLTVHGLAYTFIYTTAAIYLDGFCDRVSRTGVHQLFGMITQGIGNFAGSILVGGVLDWCTPAEGAVNYHLFWLAPTIGAFAMFMALLLLTPPPRKGNVAMITPPIVDL